MTNIERITDMEQRFDRVDKALKALEEAVDGVKHRMLDFVMTDLG